MSRCSFKSMPFSEPPAGEETGETINKNAPEKRKKRDPSNIISAILWVPKGASKANPIEAEPPSKEEIEDMLKESALKISQDTDDDEDMEIDSTTKVNEVSQALAAANVLGKSSGNAYSGTKDLCDALRELDMDNYDAEEDGIEIFGTGLGNTYYASNDLDPYLQDKDDDDDEEEIEDMTIKPSDAVIVCAGTEEKVSHLQICIFEELEDGDNNFYPHHELILPDLPLCTEWLDCNLKGVDKGNFIAVGSMGHAIEIWDLDLIDVQPFMVLGGVADDKKEAKKVHIKYKKDSHTDAVLGLSWNKVVRKYLASASADTCVKIWDLVTGKCFQTREHHTDKVQAVAWNQHVPDVLLSGSFDQSIVLVDMRYPSHTGIKSAVPADVESLAWDPHDQNSFVVSLEDGTVQGFDVRAAASDPGSGCKPCFTLHAHDKAVTTISYNAIVPKLLATGSADKTVKLWDLTNNQPSLVASKKPNAGQVFSISFSVESPFSLAIGGSKGKLRVWDTLSDAAIERKFGKYSNRKVDPVAHA